MKTKNLKSFTLIELTVSMGILALIVGLTAGVLISVVKSYQKQKVVAEIERNGDFILRTVEESLRGANSVSCVGFNNVAILPDSQGVITCSLGNNATSTPAGRLLVISSTTTKYIGRGSGTGSTPSANCASGANCFAYMLTSLGQITSAKLTSTNLILTNAPTPTTVSGVNVNKFDVKIAGGSGGVPYNITVTIDIRGGPVGSTLPLDNETRTFQSFLTLRGSYQ